MSAPVDVLAVMDADASVLRSVMRERNNKAMRSDHPEAEVRQDRARYLLEQHHEARAAVAELIERERKQRMQYAGVIGFLCEISTRITDEEEQEQIDRIVGDWCELSGWTWRRNIDRIDVTPPALARVQGGAA